MNKPLTVIARNEATSELCRSGSKIKYLIIVTIMFCLFISICSLAQSRDTTKNDKSSKFIIHTDTIKAQSLNTVVDKEAMYVIDGEISKNKLNDINPGDIMSIDILKKGKVIDSFEPLNDVVIVVTRAGAIKSYQKKFSAFSEEYKDYLMKHSDHGDSGFLYVINGVSLTAHSSPQVQSDENINKLYLLPKNQIIKVEFRKEEFNDHGIIALVLITTKK